MPWFNCNNNEDESMIVRIETDETDSVHETHNWTIVFDRFQQKWHQSIGKTQDKIGEIQWRIEKLIDWFDNSTVKRNTVVRTIERNRVVAVMKERKGWIIC